MTRKSITLAAGLLLAGLLLAACGAPPADPAAESVVPDDTPVAETPADAPADTPPPSPPATAPDLPDYKIVTLLPRDAIPAIFDPQFLAPDEADDEYEPNELVIGVEIDGDARAYSIPFLSSREIVNDTVGGRHIAVTW